MLIYNPAFDIQHAIFRVLRLLTAAPKEDFEVDRVRVLDFFMLFPEQLEALRFPSAIRKQRALFVAGYNPYRSLENPRRVFFELEPFQISALHCLVAYELVDGEKFKAGFVTRTQKDIPPALVAAIDKRNSESKVLVDLLSVEFAKLPFFGEGGLKQRSNLAEIRYDPT
jgi:hypothetical protein